MSVHSDSPNKHGESTPDSEQAGSRCGTGRCEKLSWVAVAWRFGQRDFRNHSRELRDRPWKVFALCLSAFTIVASIVGFLVDWPQIVARATACPPPPKVRLVFRDGATWKQVGHNTPTLAVGTDIRIEVVPDPSDRDSEYFIVASCPDQAPMVKPSTAVGSAWQFTDTMSSEGAYTFLVVRGRAGALTKDTIEEQLAGAEAIRATQVAASISPPLPSSRKIAWEGGLGSRKSRWEWLYPEAKGNAETQARDVELTAATWADGLKKKLDVLLERSRDIQGLTVMAAPGVFE
jgi:hypothetical protein